MATLRSNVPVTFGLITFPASVVTATQRPPSLNTLCNQGHDPARCRQDLYCPVCDSRDRKSFVKGKDLGGDTIVVVDGAELEKATPPDIEKNTITLTCHPASQVGESFPGDKVYYLRPAKGAEAQYGLMVQLLESRPDVAFVTQFAVRTASSMFRMQTREGVIVLVELARPETIVEAPAVPASDVDPQLADMASKFVDTMLRDYDEAEYRDRRAEVIEALIEGAEPSVGAAAPATATTDLMAALSAAVQAA